MLDASGYAVWKRWRVYGEEGLAGGEAALWLREKTLTVEHAGEPLSRYTVGFSASTGKPRAVARPVLFGTAIALAQPRLFGLEEQEVMDRRHYVGFVRIEIDVRISCFSGYAARPADVGRFARVEHAR